MNDLHVDRPVFIVGSASSGTTLLGVMLDRHSQFACGPEVYAFDKRQVYAPWPHVQRNIGRWLRRGLLSDGQIDTPDFFHSRDAYFCDAELLVRLAQEAASLRGFFDAFFTNYLQRRGKSRWVEKTGSNGYYLGHILELYPDARVVHLVRDGRDVVCSLLKRDPRPYHAVSHWLYNVSAAVAWRDHPAYLEVKYEALAVQPQATLERICRHLDVAFEPRMLAASQDDYWQSCAPVSIHATWSNNPLSGGVSAQSVGRYKTELTPAVEALFWRLRLSHWGRRRLHVAHRGVADLMRQLGYVDRTPAHVEHVPLKLCVEGLRQFWGRLRANWRRNRQLWLPLTRIALV